MLTHVSVFLAVALSIAASARMERHTHVRRDNTPTNLCSTGNVQCCNSVTKAVNAADILDFFSAPYNAEDSVGINCTPINFDGAGEAASCQAQPVCCSNSTYGGDFNINVGCSPFSLN